ncbi:MAG: PQQ-dependent sugar dehydrogenase [Thermoflexibacter sp.]|nr:PQQ-dependent sugar dehydrogenase [Thermoflexibacter sp.]
MKTQRLIFIFLLLFLGSYEVSNAQNIGYSRAYGNNLVFPFPLEMLPSNDGTNRMFVVSQNGIISVFPNQPNTQTAQTFLDITNTVVFAANEERGLLGMALHPNFRNNGEFFLYYTTRGTATTRMVLARYRVSPNNPNQALADSEQRLLVFDKNQANTNHNGGKIAFGSDGLLYLSIGDGGGGGDPQNNAQNRNNFFGKILRINVDGDDFPNDNQRNYRIPADNPFANGGGAPEIYAWGIRNMWKFSFDRVTRQMWGGDVGQGRWEEINIVTRGGNYGWRKFEASSVYNNADPTPSNPVATPPIFEYSSVGGASITGGFVYRGTEIPSLEGRYVYADYVRGTVSALTYNGTNAINQLLFTAMDGNNVLNVSSFGEDERGELYFIGRDTGRIYRFTSTTPPPVGNVINGIGTWSAMNNGVNGTVRAVATDTNGNVYVGGTFTNAGNIAANNIAVWNPSTGWSALGAGVSGTVSAIALRGNEVIVGGAFANAGSQSANNIAIWNGSQWQALGSGVEGPLRAIAINGNDIFVGGAFTSAGSQSANNIARWNGMTWNSLGTGTNNEIRALAFDNKSGNLYAGGNFTTAGGINAVCVARWNTTSGWSALGSGTDGFVNALAITPLGDVIAGGSFTQAGGMQANRIARWNGTVWNSLGTGVSATVNALATTNVGNIIAGGSFTLANGNIVNNIAIWNGNSWGALGAMTSVGTNGGINALAINIATVFVGGGNTTAGTITVNHIAQLQLPTINADLQDNFTFDHFSIFPNPVNEEASITYRLSKPSEVSLSIFDLAGKEVLSLVKENQQQGEYHYSFSTDALPSGLYLAYFQVDKNFIVKRLIIVQ